MKNTTYRFLILSLTACLFLGFSQTTLAQKGNIKGFVYDEKTGEPVIFCTVFLKGTTIGAATDINGFFTLANVPVGNYTLMTTFVGYDSSSTQVEVLKDRSVTVKVNLAEAIFQLGDVYIDAKATEKKTEVKVSTVTIDPKTIKKLPSLGGEADLAQYLQVLPGVVFTGDQGGQLYIRGGSPIQTKFLLDGMNVYNPFHSIGLFSVYETEVIKNVDVITGGFSAEYGNRISAVVDVTTRDGNKKRIAGRVSGSPFMSKVILEGPLMKQKENGSSATFLLTNKYSYLDRTSKKLYSYVEGGSIPYGFLDFFGKLSFNSSGGSKFNLFGFNFQDNATFEGTSEYEWDAYGGGGKFVIVPEQSSVYINTDFSYSKYALELVEADGLPRKSSIQGFDIGMDFTYFITDGDLKYGFDVTGSKTTFEFFNPLGIQIDANQNTTELAAFFKLRKFWSKVVLEPSLRLQYYGSLSAFSPEPRLGMKINVSEKLRLKFATGIYSQNFISTRSDRDVVNLFNGFLSGPEEELLDVNGETSKSKIQRAGHVIGGIEFDITKQLSVNIEPYYKKFFQLININRNKLFPEDPDFNAEEGKAFGLDFLVKYDYKGLFIWVTYSLGKIDRFDGEQTFPPHFDRRHNVNLVGSYNFGKQKSWEASARWNLGSGFPFSKTQGFFEELTFSDGNSTDYTEDNGNLGILYDEQINGGRLPYFHRLDLSMTKKISLTEHVNLEIIASVTNVYDRENLFFFDRVRFSRVNQLPIIPSGSVALSF